MTNHPIDEAAEREVFQAYWCPPDHDEAPGFEVHKQFARDAWLARARIAAEREAKLREALEYLIERAGDSDDAFYGTLSTSFVREVARAALAPETGR